MKQAWKTTFTVTVALFASWGALFAALALMNIIEALVYGNTHPPKTMGTIQDFRRWKPEYTNTERVLVGDSTYYVVEGEDTRFFASGPAAYVFDDYGNFVDWTSDSLDSYHPRIVFTPEARREPANIEKIAEHVLAPYGVPGSDSEK